MNFVLLFIFLLFVLLSLFLTKLRLYFFILFNTNNDNIYVLSRTVYLNNPFLVMFFYSIVYINFALFNLNYAST